MSTEHTTDSDRRLAAQYVEHMMRRQRHTAAGGAASPSAVPASAAPAPITFTPVGGPRPLPKIGKQVDAAWLSRKQYLALSAADTQLLTLRDPEVAVRVLTGTRTSSSSSSSSTGNVRVHLDPHTLSPAFTMDIHCDDIFGSIHAEREAEQHSDQTWPLGK